MSQQEKIQFTVKNGRYAGSVIDLEVDTEYSLGRSFHCDIAIDDARFAERQMLLKVNDAGVQIKLLAEGTLSVNGQSKDTNVQSEWRQMNPDSVFAMNDLEFAFDVPEALLLAYQSNSDTDEQPITISTSTLKNNTSGSSRNRTTSSAQADPAFTELETQVPGENDEENHAGVLPSLADELNFKPDVGPKYTRAKKTVTPPQDSRSPIWIGAGLALFALVFASGYYYLGLEPTAIEPLTVQKESNQSTQLANSQAGNKSARLNDRNLKAFVYEDEVAEAVAQSTTPVQMSDDPFAAYDQHRPLDKPPEPIKPEVKSTGELVEEDLNLDQKTYSTDETADNFTGGEGIYELDEPTATADVFDDSNVGVNELPDYNVQPTAAKKTNGAQVDADFGSLDGQLKHQSDADDADDSQQAEQAQSNSKLTNGSAAATDDEPITINDSAIAGGIDDKEDSKDLLAVIHGKAMSDSIVVRLTEDLLAGLGLGHLRVATRKPKKNEIKPVIVVNGYINNRSQWIRAKEILAQDVPSIGTLADSVSSPEVRKAQLERWIAASDLKQKVTTYLSEQGLVAKVNLNPSQGPTWDKIAQRYVEAFDNNPELFVMKDPGGWLQIQSISFGDRPYLVTSEGAILTPGAKLKNGYTIVAIRKSGVELKDQFGSYTYVF